MQSQYSDLKILEKLIFLQLPAFYFHPALQARHLIFGHWHQNQKVKLKRRQSLLSLHFLSLNSLPFYLRFPSNQTILILHDNFHSLSMPIKSLSLKKFDPGLKEHYLNLEHLVEKLQPGICFLNL